MEIVTNFLLSVLTTAGLILSLLPNLCGLVTTYAPEQDDILLNCAVVSDTHADSNLFRDRTDTLRKAYAGIGESSRKIDVLLNIGDITNSGSKKDYRTQKRLEKAYIRPSHTVACFGNHDSWNGSADPHYDEAKRLYLQYIAGKGIDSKTVYYAAQIDGYYFICLGTESLDLHENLPTYSAEQLQWFDRMLTEAEKTDLPVFVLSHLPITGRNGIGSSPLPQTVDEILQSHAGSGKPIFFFSGHCHDFTPAILDSANNVYYINMPSTEYNDQTEYVCNDNGGMGLAMEIYADKVILKARNYITDQWIDGYRFEITF